MKNFYNTYLSIMTAGKTSGILRPTFFFEAEWWIVNMTKVMICLDIVRLVQIGLATQGIGTMSKDEMLGHLLSITVTFVLIAFGVVGLQRLFRRQVTYEQFRWCEHMKPFLWLPTPTQSMTKVELAVFVRAYQQMTPEEQERHYPYADDTWEG